MERSPPAPGLPNRRKRRRILRCPCALAAYDGDVEKAQGIPKGAEERRRRLLGADAFIVSSPEYNGSMPGMFKTRSTGPRALPTTAVRWEARPTSECVSVHGRGNRGLWVLRMPLEHLAARIYPDMFSLAQAHNGLVHGQIADAARARFEKNLERSVSSGPAKSRKALPVDQARGGSSSSESLQVSGRSCGIPAPT